MKKIGVFLSSKPNLPESFSQAAEEVGAWIGRTGRTLVYGGSNRGLMEVLAQSTKRNGGRVIGVVPEIVMQRGYVSDNIDITFHTADLNDRKAVMVRESDLLLALPGGIGTLDEIFTVLASNSLSLTHKPVVLYNVDHCWDTAILALQDLAQRGLISTEIDKIIHIVSNVEDLEKICSE